MPCLRLRIFLGNAGKKIQRSPEVVIYWRHFPGWIGGVNCLLKYQNFGIFFVFIWTLFVFCFVFGVA